MQQNGEKSVVSLKTAQLYDAFYFETGCGLPYNHNEKHWQQFFGAMADRIVSDIQPASALDAGCAMGFLVEALRQRQVDAFGIDISDYAIRQVSPAVQPFCSLRSVTDPLPRGYDLIICIEVLEHLFPQEAARAIANFCNNADDILFSSTPYDFKEVTHFNVQSPDYWAEIFARHGFYRDVDFDAGFITPWAMRFRKSTAPFGRIVSAYERRFWHLDRQLQAGKALALEQRNSIADKERGLLDLKQSYQALLLDKDKATQALESQIEEKNRQIDELTASRAETEQVVTELTAQQELLENRLDFEKADRNLVLRTISATKEKTVLTLNQELRSREQDLKTLRGEKQKVVETMQALESQLAALQSSNTWKAACKLRAARLRLLPPGSLRERLARVGARGLKVLKRDGAKSFVVKAFRAWKDQVPSAPPPPPAPVPAFPTPEIFAEGCELVANTTVSAPHPYDLWIKFHEPHSAELERQRQFAFPYKPTLSVVVPTYNTPTKFLVAMINSVLAQTYSNWELCIADGSNADHPCRKVLHYFSLKDPRIKVRFLEANLGIAGNSNAALALATGEYVALLDHDDTLAPFALYEVNYACNVHYPEVDFIYSDEDKINEAGDQRSDPHFKPDWSPDTLRSHNYICHLSVFRRAILNRIGGFQAGFDGSQDYDLILRATEQARKIVHLPKILYHWRNHQGSCASGAEVKLYAYESARKAIKGHLDRTGLGGTVQDGITLGVYQVNLPLTKHPLISIIIPNRNNCATLRRCLESIGRSSYANWELVIVENHSDEPEVFEYYEELKKHPRVKIVEWQGSFNYSAVNNFAVSHAEGEVLLFLNNDIEAISHDWLERMLQYALRPDVGAVGAKLYYPDNTVQHGGVILALGGVAGHAHHWYTRTSYGYFGRLIITQNLSAVTAACLMTRRQVFDEVGGFDERFTLAFNDVDFCIKIRRNNYLIVWTPFAELYHFESLTRGEDDTPEKKDRFRSEVHLFVKKWYDLLEKGDPYYNPHLTLLEPDFSLRVQEADPVERLRDYLYV
jgi:GT2 family glycosyltransferase